MTNRAIVSSFLLLILVLLGWTGIEMYLFAYQYKVASLHTFVGSIFLLIIALHLTNNFQSLKRYLLSTKAKNSKSQSIEASNNSQRKMPTMQAYTVIVAGVLLIPLYEFDLPPITTVYDFGKAQRGTTDVFYKQMSTNAENGRQPITVEVLRGAEATDPQVAIWIEDESGTLLNTLYVSSALATNNFFAIDGSTPRRPEALPIWSHRRGVKAADGLYAPDDDTQLADGVTAATPNTNFILSSGFDVSGDSRIRVMLEVNASFDWNETYHENAYPDDPVYSGSGSVGQPALLFATPFINPRESNILKMRLVGRGHHSGQDGEIYADLSGITTARDLVARALVFIEPPEEQLASAL